jgi:hypothetical protein
VTILHGNPSQSKRYFFFVDDFAAQFVLFRAILFVVCSPVC